MAKKSGNSRSGSLKGKIRLAMTALAFVAVLWGLISFGVVFLFGSSFYPVFLPFIFLAIIIFFFGRWLSDEIAYPVEKVALLAKSYERGVSTTVPKTSGSRETDELAQTIARLGGQVEKLVSSMEEVAEGNLDIVISPAAASDRISRVFQKLLLKVSESIHARQELEKLKKSITGLSAEISSVKFGNLNAKIKTDAPEIKEISDTLAFLIEQLAEIAALVKSGGSQARNSALTTRKMLLEIILGEENRMREMNLSSAKLKRIPDMARNISEELLQSAGAGNQSVEKARLGRQAMQENLSAVGNLRRQIQETVKRIQSLSIRSQEIGKIAKQSEDLSQRLNLIALNASIQTGEPNGEAGHSFALISEEIERIAERAGNIGKQISVINKTIQSEFGETENSLLATINEVAGLSRLTIETGSALDEIEKYAAGILNLQGKMFTYSKEQANESEAAFKTFILGISETENSLAHLKDLANNAAKISDVLEDLQILVEDLKIPSVAAETASPISTYPSEKVKFSV